MTDDAPRPLTEEGRARVHAARAGGGVCASCGRALAPDDPVWVVRFDVTGRGVYWRAPVAEECASPEVLRVTDLQEPEPCTACGRGVYYPSATPRRRWVSCSRRCAMQAAKARYREARGL